MNSLNPAIELETLNVHQLLFSRNEGGWLADNCLGIIICYKTEIKIIVFDRMVYPDPKFLISKTKKQPHFFLRLEANFFDPMLSQKVFATNSLN